MALTLRNLVLERGDGVRLLGPLDLDLAPGDRLGLAGESGSGKSLLVKALFKILPPGVRQTAGQVTAFGRPLERPGQEPRMAWVPQEHGSALNPLLTVRQHLNLLPRALRRESLPTTLQRLAPLLERLGLPRDQAFLGRRPHQLSGGQRQRLCLAMALSCDPELLVLDEPTSALDGRARDGFLDTVLELQRERGLGFLWITHDLDLAGRACDRLLVLYGGSLVEAGPTARLLSAPRHPYPARLLQAALGLPSHESGFLPAPEDRPAGCPFQPRCSDSIPSCRATPPWIGSREQGVRCLQPPTCPE
ncbi:MAG: ABC transporter ATP-binding protein [Acidobacteriota bacterium]|nr:ABC transporter ATP-binding protein [Acidobacteriota bacterium]